MRLMKQMGSATAIVFLLAIIGGIIIAASLGDSDPITGTINLLRERPYAALPAVLVGVGFLARSFQKPKNKMKKYIALRVVDLSMALFIFSLLYIILSVTTESVKIREGDTVVEGLKAEKIRFDLPDEILVIGEDADIQIRNPVIVVRSEKGIDTVGSFPFSRFAGMYGYINDAGISPQCEIHTQGSVTKTAFAVILPPGKKHTQHMLEGGKVITRLAPKRTFHKGRLEARVFDLRVPSFHMKIENQRKEILFDDIVHEDSVIQNDDVSIQCGKNLSWVEIVMQKSGSFLFVYFSLFGIFMGLFLLPAELFRRRR